MADDVLIEHDGDIAKVTLNMAEDGNRVSDPLATQLATTLREVASGARAIIFTGAGDDFCMGRSGMGRKGGGEPPEALDLRDNNEIIFDAYGAFRDIDVPVVSVVRGRALGFGCALAAVCDMTLAADNARFALPEMGHNIMPTMAMSSLVDRLHRKAAVFMTYSTEEIDAHTALSYGLVRRSRSLPVTPSTTISERSTISPATYTPRSTHRRGCKPDDRQTDEGRMKR